MCEKPQMAHNEIFNIVLIVIGILAFVLFYFVLARCIQILFFELKSTHEFLSDCQHL